MSPVSGSATRYGSGTHPLLPISPGAPAGGARNCSPALAPTHMPWIGGTAPPYTVAPRCWSLPSGCRSAVGVYYVVRSMAAQISKGLLERLCPLMEA